MKELKIYDETEGMEPKTDFIFAFDLDFLGSKDQIQVYTNDDPRGGVVLTRKQARQLGEWMLEFANGGKKKSKSRGKHRG